MGRRIKFFTVLVMAYRLASAGQGLASQGSTAQSQDVAGAISSGTLIQVELSKDVDAKKAHSGDEVRTKLWADVRAGDNIILPKKTLIVGHVAEAQARTKANPESKLTIAFDKAVLKNGSEIPLHAVIERVQLSPLALAAAGKDNSQLYSANPGSTTNIAMPAQLPEPGRGGPEDQTPSPGPTNVRDPNIGVQQDTSRALTMLSNRKEDVKLKHFATLDLRICH
jgi:hypothetical protein